MRKNKKSRVIKKIDLHKFLPSTSGKITPPGTIEYIGRPRSIHISIDVISYGENEIKRGKIAAVSDLRPFLSSDSFKWIQIIGLQDVAMLQQAGELFQIDALTMESIANTTERPDVGEYEHYIFAVL